MNISLFSFLMSVLSSTVFIIVIHALRNQPFFLKSFGVHTLLIMYGLSLFRMIFVIELPFAVPVGLKGVFSQTYAQMRQYQVSVGGSRIAFLDIVFCVWIAAALANFVRLMWRERLVRKDLSHHRRNKNYAAERVLANVRKKSADKIFVSVCVCPSIDTPIGLGLFQKWIYLPDEEYTQEELYYIMKHEYIHFSNRDGLVKLLTLLLCCIFWWNPAVYLLKKDVEQILEIKCDINATHGFSKKERLEYLLTIVRVLKGKPRSTHDSPPLMATGLFSRTEHDDIRERFELITKATKRVGIRYQAVFVGLAVLVTVFSYTFVLQPAFEPPVEDIYSDGSTLELDSEKLYILQHHDMTHSIVLENGEMYPISDPVLQMYVDLGTEIRKE